MKRERIRAIIKKKVKDIAALAEDVDTSYGMEAIHAFRLAIKSLRSFLRLQQMHTGSKKIRISAGCKELYAIAGGIRDAQLEIAHWEQEGSYLPAYMTLLHHTVARQKKEWARCYTHKTFKELGKKLVAIKYRAMPPDVPGAFFKAQIGLAADMVNAKHPNAEQLHTARKKAKDVLYVAKTIAKEWESAQERYTDLPLKQLDTMTDLIGHLNDERMRLDHLSTFIPHPDQQEEQTTLTTLKDREAAALAKQKRRVTSAVRLLVKGFVG